ncbi:hypothetical protein RSAG8_12394, partial [Rhizoctonia solani AG-8 WAC10335]
MRRDQSSACFGPSRSGNHGDQQAWCRRAWRNTGLIFRSWARLSRSMD